MVDIDAATVGRVAPAVAELERAVGGDLLRARGGDLAAALAAIAYLERVAGEVRERLAVAAVLDAGWSYTELAEVLGISRQGAHKQYAGAVATEQRLRLRRSTRAAAAADNTTEGEIMASYTVQIEASSAAGDIWQALHPAENATGESAEEVARWTAQNQDVAEGNGWRVCVWEGADTDTGVEPAYVLAASEV